METNSFTLYLRPLLAHYNQTTEKKLIEDALSRESKLEYPSFSAEIVTITAESGSARQDFTVHKSFAVYMSPVLERAFTGAFSESTTNTLTLDSSPAAVAVLLEWMYSRTLATTSAARRRRRPLSSELCFYADLWVLADYLQVPALGREALAHLVLAVYGAAAAATASAGTSAQQLPSPAHIADLWGRTARGCPVRACIAEAFVVQGVWDAEGGGCGEFANMEELPRDFLYDMNTHMMGKLSYYRERRHENLRLL